MTAATLALLRRIAGPLVEVYDDRECGCYRASAAPGYAFDDGTLHELIGSYLDWGPGGKRAAREDLADRIRAYRAFTPTTVAPCTDADCEWCGRWAPDDLTELLRHEAVSDVSDERGSGDGIFVFLAPGWRCSRNGTRRIHEDTEAEVLAAFAERRPRTDQDD
jgi:hypothetical protein